MQNLTPEKVAFGLVTRDCETRPNVLRAVLGEESVKSGGNDWETDTISVLETNLDDISSEVLGDFVERALNAGALDVVHTAIQMKKNRPGVQLSVLCAEVDADHGAHRLVLLLIIVRAHRDEREREERKLGHHGCPVLFLTTQDRPASSTGGVM